MSHTGSESGNSPESKERRRRRRDEDEDEEDEDDTEQKEEEKDADDYYDVEENAEGALRILFKEVPKIFNTSLKGKRFCSLFLISLSVLDSRFCVHRPSDMPNPDRTPIYSRKRFDQAMLEENKHLLELLREKKGSEDMRFRWLPPSDNPIPDTKRKKQNGTAKRTWIKFKDSPSTENWVFMMEDPHS